MGKTFKRNSYRKPKQHGRTFEKKNKSDKWKHHNHQPETEPSFSYDEKYDTDDYT